MGMGIRRLLAGAIVTLGLFSLIAVLMTGLLWLGLEIPFSGKCLILLVLISGVALGVGAGYLVGAGELTDAERARSHLPAPGRWTPGPNARWGKLPGQKAEQQQIIVVQQPDEDDVFGEWGL